MEKSKLPSVYFSSHAMIKLIYSSYLGEHNKPEFTAQSYLFQSLLGRVHFHHCLN